jgi:hypothetical protein
VIYCRVSTREQVQNFSLVTQRKACEAYCAQHGIEVAHVFVEEGEAVEVGRQVLGHEPAVDEDRVIAVAQALPHQALHPGAAVAFDAEREAGDVAAEEAKGVAAAVEGHRLQLAEAGGPVGLLLA